MRTLQLRLLIIGVATTIVAASAETAKPSTSPVAATDTKPIKATVQVGCVTEIDWTHQITGTSVGDPKIADISKDSHNDIVIWGKSVGETRMILHDERGQTVFSITVLPTDFAALAYKIQNQIEIPTVSVRAVSDTIVLQGTANEAASALALKIAQAYTSKVVNLIATKFISVPEPEQPEMIPTTIPPTQFYFEYKGGAHGYLISPNKPSDVDK